MWRNVTAENARIDAIGGNAPGTSSLPTIPRPINAPSIGLTIFSISYPSARLATVIPSCDAER